MDTLDIGKKLVAHSNADRADLALDELYGDNIVSIEPAADDSSDNRTEGIAAVREKHAFWNDNNEIHGVVAQGPFMGHLADSFVVKFAVDVTPSGGERLQFEELGIYTVSGSKVVKEEFLALQT